MSDKQNIEISKFQRNVGSTNRAKTEEQDLLRERICLTVAQYPIVLSD